MEPRNEVDILREDIERLRDELAQKSYNLQELETGGDSGDQGDYGPGKYLGKAIPHVIAIEPSLNKGFMVKIGCANLVYTDTDSLIAGLTRYLRNPSGYEEVYNNAFGQNVGMEQTSPRIGGLKLPGLL